MSRNIIHIDLDAFYCAVEELINPQLVGKPFAVGGRPDERGVVASCSYPARRFGIRSAMPMTRAVRLCPDLIIISSHYDRYSQVSAQMIERLKDLSSLVEQISIDEAFVDVSELKVSVRGIAEGIQKRVNEELCLPCSLGAASNKLVAKIATEVGKAAAQSGRPPNAITIVEPGREEDFLAPLPVERLWGVGPKTADRLKNLGIRTIGDLAHFPEQELVREFGKNGLALSEHSHGIDDSPISTSHEPKSISQETTFSHDISDQAELIHTLHNLSERVGGHLRKEHLAGSTVRLKIRWPDFTTLTRQTTFEAPIDQDEEIYASALTLFRRVWQPGKAVRLIGVGVSGLQVPIRQLQLWETPTEPDAEKHRQLQSALDQLRGRYGRSIIKRLGELDKDG